MKSIALTFDLVTTEAAPPQEIMDKDALLLKNLHKSSKAILHHYEWQGDAATHGCFVNPYDYLDRDAVKETGLSLGKRPTGGGIIFHIADLAFSFLLPVSHPAYSTNTLESYAFVNNIVIDAITSVTGEKTLSLLPVDPQALDTACQHFCLAKPTKYDVIVNGRKLGGAAQRRTRNGFLHQGSITLGMLSQSYLKKILKKETRVQEAMNGHSQGLLSADWTEAELQTLRKSLKDALTQSFVKMEL
jgi:lipoate-protein ligase A